MEYLEVCREGWPAPTNTCFEVEAFGRPGCTDNSCEANVCKARPECCTATYNEECVQTALKVCRLPEPTNHCMEPSTLPGCTDTNCLENAVCIERPSCCEYEYDSQCVEIAKSYHSSTCPAPKPTHKCTDENPSIGGCVDTRCARSVCDIQSDCCNTDTEVGSWTEPCTKVAKELCQPNVYERYVKKKIGIEILHHSRGARWFAQYSKMEESEESLSHHLSSSLPSPFSFSNSSNLISPISIDHLVRAHPVIHVANKRWSIVSSLYRSEMRSIRSYCTMHNRKLFWCGRLFANTRFSSNFVGKKKKLDQTRNVLFILQPFQAYLLTKPLSLSPFQNMDYLMCPITKRNGM